MAIVHPLYKLGRLATIRDKRNLRFEAILAKTPRIPTEYSFDTEHPGIPTPTFGNNDVGDCVMAYRAHATLRFEYLEQKKILKITDADVLGEYFKETGGKDTGLVIIDSLKQWRTKGWKAAGSNYSILSFAEIALKNQTQLKQTVYLDVCACLGLDLPESAQDEIDAGKPWSKTTGTGRKIDSWGGHCVIVVGYTKVGPVCITWGQRQQMTWAWYFKYCTEAYAVIDAVNTAKKKAHLHLPTIHGYLEKIAA